MAHFELRQELHIMRLGNLIVPGNKEVFKQNKKKKKWRHVMRNRSHLKEPTMTKVETNLAVNIDIIGL